MAVRAPAASVAAVSEEDRLASPLDAVAEVTLHQTLHGVGASVAQQPF